jgi:thiamine kinase-like enzyme
MRYQLEIAENSLKVRAIPETRADLPATSNDLVAIVIHNDFQVRNLLLSPCSPTDAQKCQVAQSLWVEFRPIH